MSIKEIIAAERWDHRKRGLISTKWHHASLDRIEAAVSELEARNLELETAMDDHVQNSSNGWESAIVRGLRARLDEQDKALAKYEQDDARYLQRIDDLEAQLEIANERIAELERPVARLTGEVKFGCHCDVFDDEEPDECVIPSGRINDCHYARTRKYTAPEQCPEWRPIKKARGES